MKRPLHTNIGLRLFANNMRYEGLATGELGGGLNNMLMNLAQMLDDACRRDAVLVLPRMTSGWRFFRESRHTRRPLAFGDVFDAAHFIERVRPCQVVEADAVPAGEVVPEFRTSDVAAVNASWPYDYALPRIYAALRPSARLSSGACLMSRHQASSLCGFCARRSLLPCVQSWSV